MYHFLWCRFLQLLLFFFLYHTLHFFFIFINGNIVLKMLTLSYILLNTNLSSSEHFNFGHVTWWCSILIFLHQNLNVHHTNLCSYLNLYSIINTDATTFFGNFSVYVFIFSKKNRLFHLLCRQQ